MNTVTFPLFPTTASQHGRFTQTLAESSAISRPRLEITTGLFETHPHLLAQRSTHGEPAWKREQHRRSAGRPR